MESKIIKLAINATNIGPQGGINGLVGYLTAWKKFDLSINLYASDEYIINEVKGARPDINIIPCAVGWPYWAKQVYLYTQLGKRITTDGANVLMSTNKLTPKCDIPQLVHHRNAYLFLSNDQYRFINKKVGLKYRLKRHAAIQALKKCNAFFLFLFNRSLMQVEIFCER